MIDGGSHVGYFAHLALAHGCSVVAVEPFATSRDFVSYTASLKGVADALTVIPAIVSNEDGKIGLFV